MIMNLSRIDRPVSYERVLYGDRAQNRFASFVFDNHLVIVNGDNLMTRNSELRVEKGLEEGTLHDELMNLPATRISREVTHFANFRTVF